MCEVILSGPVNDPLACKVRSSFRGLLHDASSAHDFIMDRLLGMRKRAAAGTLIREEHLELPLDELLGRLAARKLLRLRAIDFAAQMQTAGIVALPGDGPMVGTLDIGEDGQTIDVPDDGADVAGRSAVTPVLIRQLTDGQPVLEIDLPDDTRITAVVETATIQTWPRLVPDLPIHLRLKAEVEGRLRGGCDALMAAHSDALTRLDSDRRRLSGEIIDHPGMAAQTREDIHRKLLKIEIRKHFEPLDGEGLQALLGLASINAGDQRNTKYRKALRQLFPGLYAEFEALEAGS